MQSRTEIPENLKWRLEDIFETNEDWEKSFEFYKSSYVKMLDYKGKLHDENILLEFLNLRESLGLVLSRLYVYARMRKDEDTANSLYQAMTDRIESLAVESSSATSFVMPELVKISDADIDKMIADERFKDFDVLLKEVKRNKKLILSEAEEKIIADVGLFSDGARQIFSMFDNADIRFKDVILPDGTAVKMSHGVYSLLLQNENQSVRRDAFNSMFEVYKNNENTLAQIYATNVKKDWFYAKTRGFESSLSYAMYGENVDDVAYKNLLKAVEKGLKPLHEYVAMRKEFLKLSELNMYDLYVPIVENQDIKLEYNDACKLVKEALKPLGERYLKLLDKAFAERWIDVVETKGKRSGAYSWGTYGVHPYVLLNYQKTSHDVFTIAHELGHAMHSYLSNEALPSSKADYEIFVAEIASTVNEVLLIKHLLKSATGEMRKYLLSYYLDMFRTTLFRQTMFAEFETAAHSLVENSEPVTAKCLNEIYYELNKKYYGNAVNHNQLIEVEWARIPHFYTSFYVYKYATGLTSAISIVKRILSGDTDGYFKFLSAGGSMPPLEILKLAGVNMYGTEPFDDAMEEFSSVVDELKKCL
ncbi:MAG: oligoendopeptidase F [Christensenellales bacterium]